MKSSLDVALCLISLAVVAGPAQATSGPGCMVIVNVARNDSLKVRARPSADSRIVDELPPDSPGFIHTDGPCTPKDAEWSSRWCPITYYGGNRTSRGWVKARYVRDSECPSVRASAPQTG
jgi:hypothetical protein